MSAQDTPRTDVVIRRVRVQSTDRAAPPAPDAPPAAAPPVDHRSELITHARRRR